MALPTPAIAPASPFTGKYKGLYSNTAEYAAKDIVVDANGVLWMSNFNRTVGIWPASPNEGIAGDTWRRVTGKDRGQFNFENNYAIGDVAYDDTGSIGGVVGFYRAVAAHASGNAPNAADWSLTNQLPASGLNDVASSSPATMAWGNHTRITSGVPGAILTLANTTTANVGDTLEIYNATAFDLVVAVNVANSILGSPTDLTLPPNSAVTARIVAPLTVELVGIGKPLEEVAGTNGHVIIGGTMLQWGRFSSTVDNDEAFTFATAFGGVPYIVTATISHNLTTTVNGRVLQSSISAVGFSFNREDTIANTDNPTVHYWAVGPAP